MKNEPEVTDTWRAEDGATHLLILPPRWSGGDIYTPHPSYHSGPRQDSLMQQVKLELSQLGQGFQFPWPGRSLMKCSVAPLAGSQVGMRTQEIGCLPPLQLALEKMLRFLSLLCTRLALVISQL